MGDRLEVRKTYKLFIGGAFPRSESGRSYQPAARPQCNVARASRKDARDAVLAARKGLGKWSAASASLRGQILYRMAEMLESRRVSLAQEVEVREVDAAIDLAVWYAGMCDKLQSLLGSQNAVSGPFFNFSAVEPTGVVAVVAPREPSLYGLLALVLPVLVGGNAAVAVVSETAPCAGLELGEVLAVSDLPAGAVNLLAGMRDELLPQLASHRDIDGLLVASAADAAASAAAADGVKRVRYADPAALSVGAPAPGLLWVEPFVEVKTFWHPVAP